MKFNREVTENLVGEKLMKRFLKLGEPHGPSIRAGHANIHYHLDYIGFLTEKRTWLAGEDFGPGRHHGRGAPGRRRLHRRCAVGVEHEAAREWYAKVKSRSSFKALPQMTGLKLSPVTMRMWISRPLSSI